MSQFAHLQNYCFARIRFQVKRIKFGELGVDLFEAYLRRRAQRRQGIGPFGVSGDPGRESLTARLHAREGGGAAELGAALANGPVEEPLGQRRRHEITDAPRAGRFTEDRDAFGIASEGRDVSLDPPQSCDLVEQAVIARNPVLGFLVQLGVGEKAQDAEPIVEGDDDRTAPGQCRAVVDRARPAAGLQRPAMNPNHHGPALIGG